MSLFNNDSNMAGIYRGKLVKFDETTMKSKVYIPSIHTINPYEYEEGSDEWSNILKLLPNAPWCVYKYDGVIKHEDGADCWVIFEGGNIKYPVIMSYFMNIIIIDEGDNGSTETNYSTVNIGNAGNYSSFTEYIWTYFKEALKNEYGVAGLMGNLEAESALCPYRLQSDFSEGYTESIDYTSKVDSGEISEYDFVNNGPNGGGYGLAQWTYKTRKQNMYSMWKSSSRYSSIGCIELACDFLLNELQSDTYIGVYNTLVDAKSISEASNKVLHKFENPKVQDSDVENTRLKNSQAIYEKYKSN